MYRTYEFITSKKYYLQSAKVVLFDLNHVYLSLSLKN